MNDNQGLTKKKCDFIPYLRKVVESYRAGLVSSTELKTGLQMDFKRFRHLNAECRPFGILSIEFYPLYPKKSKKMKSDNARIKELEAKIKLLEKEFFKLKAVTLETLVDEAEKTGSVLTVAYFHQKQVRT